MFFVVGCVKSLTMKLFTYVCPDREKEPFDSTSGHGGLALLWSEGVHVQASRSSQNAFYASQQLMFHHSCSIAKHLQLVAGCSESRVS